MNWLPDSLEILPKLVTKTNNPPKSVHANINRFQSAPPHDDVVSCIFLMPSMANGVTHGAAECPLYVYSYRCDSAETAELLKEQLQARITL